MKLDSIQGAKAHDELEILPAMELISLEESPSPQKKAPFERVPIQCPLQQPALVDPRPSLLVLVLKSVAPDGRIPLEDLVDILSQSAAAGKHLPAQWMLLSKKQSMYIQRINQLISGFLC